MRRSSVAFLTQQEIQRVLSTARRSARDHCMILLAYRHGLRASEVCGLQLDDLDLDGGHILCRRRKGSMSNWQRLGPDEIEVIRRWIETDGGSGSVYLFPNRQGNAIGRQHFHTIFRQIAITAGISPRKAHPHALKHSIGTHLANAGVPVQVIQQRLGHRCINNTMVYLTIASEYVDRAVASAIEAGAVI